MDCPLTDWSVRQLNPEERAWLHREHMRRDFPDQELKPLDLLEQLVAAGLSSVWGCFRGGALAGYYVLAHEPGNPLVLLDYLAVLPELRDTGCGSLILAHLRETLPAGTWLCIESERPEAVPPGEEHHTRVRRVAFYRRNGAVRTPVRVCLFGVDFAILVLSREGQPTADRVEQCYQRLYRAMLEDTPYRDRLQEKVRVTREPQSGENG